jgi:hypothetical protein
MVLVEKIIKRYNRHNEAVDLRNGQISDYLKISDQEDEEIK